MRTPELRREVHARADREAGARHQDARVLDLEVVEIGAAALEIVVDRVAGAVHDLIAEAGLLDERARRLVDLGAGDRPMLARCDR